MPHGHPPHPSAHPKAAAATSCRGVLPPGLPPGLPGSHAAGGGAEKGYPCQGTHLAPKHVGPCLPWAGTAGRLEPAEEPGYTTAWQRSGRSGGAAWRQRGREGTGPTPEQQGTGATACTAPYMACVLLRQEGRGAQHAPEYLRTHHGLSERPSSRKGHCPSGSSAPSSASPGRPQTRPRPAAPLGGARAPRPPGPGRSLARAPRLSPTALRRLWIRARRKRPKARPSPVLFTRPGAFGESGWQRRATGSGCHAKQYFRILPRFEFNVY